MYFFNKLLTLHNCKTNVNYCSRRHIQEHLLIYTTEIPMYKPVLPKTTSGMPEHNLPLSWHFKKTF